VNCGVNVRGKDRDQIEADHPSHIIEVFGKLTTAMANKISRTPDT